MKNRRDNRILVVVMVLAAFMIIGVQFSYGYENSQNIVHNRHVGERNGARACRIEQKLGMQQDPDCPALLKIDVSPNPAVP